MVEISICGFIIPNYYFLWKAFGPAFSRGVAYSPTVRSLHWDMQLGLLEGAGRAFQGQHVLCSPVVCGQRFPTAFYFLSVVRA